MRRRVFAAAAAAVFLSGMSACGAQAGGGPETQESFIARCTQETIAANAEAADWAESVCTESWNNVVAAGPMAEAILAAAPERAEAVDVSSLSGTLAMVAWDARAEGVLAASGRLGDNLSVQVERSPPSLNFYWSEVGMPIPYDVVEALKGRGAEVALVGCMSFGMSEVNRSYRITAPGHAPFTLGVYARMAPTANAHSFYNVSTDLSGAVKTLADLGANGDDWAASCPF
jgi:hypothetical protein